MERNEMRFEWIRRELEKRYTHVTFVSLRFENLEYEYSIWYVNDEMEEVVIRTEWELNEILTRLELDKLKNVDRGSEKYGLFKKLMIKGIIDLDHTLYKKTTLKKLEALT